QTRSAPAAAAGSAPAGAGSAAAGAAATTTPEATNAPVATVATRPGMARTPAHHLTGVDLCAACVDMIRPLLPPCASAIQDVTSSSILFGSTTAQPCVGHRTVIRSLLLEVKSGSNITFQAEAMNRSRIDQICVRLCAHTTKRRAVREAWRRWCGA